MFDLETILDTPYKKLNRFFLFTLLFLSLFSPPYLVIFIFFRDLFIQLNFINLLFLSISSHLPFFLFNFYVIYYLKKVNYKIKVNEDFEKIKFEMMDNILMHGASQNLKVFYGSLFVTSVAGNMTIIDLMTNYLLIQLVMFSLTFIFPLLLFLENEIDNGKVYTITKLGIYGGGFWLYAKFGHSIVKNLLSMIIS